MLQYSMNRSPVLSLGLNPSRAIVCYRRYKKVLTN